MNASNVVIGAVLTFINVSSALASDWSSPNGAIVVTEPDQRRFTKVDNPPAPFQALWVSQDEKTKLGVMEIAKPPNVQLIKSAGEEGFAEELSGKVTESSSRFDNGREIWTVTVKGSLQGNAVVGIQPIVEVDDKVHKVMGLDFSEDAEAREATQLFVNSVRVMKSPSMPLAANRQASDSTQDAPSAIDWHTVSKTLGGVGGILLICIVIWLVVNRNRRTK